MPSPNTISLNAMNVSHSNARAADYRLVTRKVLESMPTTYHWL